MNDPEKLRLVSLWGDLCALRGYVDSIDPDNIPQSCNWPAWVTGLRIHTVKLSVEIRELLEVNGLMEDQETEP